MCIGVLFWVMDLLGPFIGASDPRAPSSLATGQLAALGPGFALALVPLGLYAQYLRALHL